MFYILLSVGGLISSINTPELIEKLRPFAYLPSAGGGMSGVRKNGCIKVQNWGKIFKNFNCGCRIIVLQKKLLNFLFKNLKKGEANHESRFV
jgi:hypothetical protein